MKKIYTLLSAALLFGGTASAQIVGGDFEAGLGGDWSEYSDNFGTPICDDASCGNCGGPCGPNGGTYYCWFGGVGGAIETGFVEQTSFFASGSSAVIEMYVKIAIPGPGDANDKLELSVDGNVEGTLTTLDSAGYKDAYAMWSVDVSSYADGGNHLVKIEGVQHDTFLVNILVDDVILKVDGEVTSLFEFETGENEVVFYPNPATDFVNLAYRNVEGNTQVTITDMSGKIISQKEVYAAYGKSYKYDTSDMAPGTYVITVTQGKEILRSDEVIIME